MATLTRLCGVRELACGIGIITQRNPAMWVKARVAGDAMDLAALAVALPFSPSRAGRLTATAAAAAAVTALDVYCSGELAGRRAAPLHIATSITLDRPLVTQPSGAKLTFIHDPWGTSIELNERPNPL